MRAVNLFGGSGGWEEGFRILGAHDLEIVGIEWNRDVCATARAAGHRRLLADVRTVDVDDYLDVDGFIASSPCPTFSDGGTRSGRTSDYQHVLDVWTSIGWGIPAGAALAGLQATGLKDPRTALLATAGVWALGLLTAGRCSWVAFEQVPACEYAWEDLAAELYAVGCEYVDVTVLDAADFGVPSRRNRVYLVASYDGQPRTGSHPGLRFAGVAPGRLPVRGTGPSRSMADALGWGSGHRVLTRGNRKPTGGGSFSADGPAWCLTGRARSWCRDDGLRLTPSEAGFLSGFPRSYPWQGSRTSAFQQAADVVSPVMAAHVLAGVLGVDAQDHIEAHTARLYDTQVADTAA